MFFFEFVFCSAVVSFFFFVKICRCVIVFAFRFVRGWCGIDRFSFHDVFDMLMFRFIFRVFKDFYCLKCGGELDFVSGGQNILWCLQSVF